MSRSERQGHRSLCPKGPAQENRGKGLVQRMAVDHTALLAGQIVQRTKPPEGSRWKFCGLEAGWSQ